MRKKFVAGNWKMNMTGATALDLVRSLNQMIIAGGAAGSVDVAVCPPFVYLPQIIAALKGSTLAVGAQNCYLETSGAFTGEISPAMIKEIGCQYVILGHSERRHILGETDEIINKKVTLALAAGLDPIFCIGELLAEREANQTEAVLERQIRKGLAGISGQQMLSITVAYEPVWAIGTGKTASPAQAQAAHKFSRSILAALYGPSIANAVRIQYGGSVKGSNAAELLGQPDVDGALVGGASLKADEFAAIVLAGKPAGGCGCGCSCGR